MRRLMAKPSPVPRSLLVTKGSNIRSRMCSAIPVPESVTVTRQPPSGSSGVLDGDAQFTTIGHGFDAVQQQIDEYLMQLSGIAFHQDRHVGRSPRTW